ncbi:hypothetical protein RGUI_3904 [Rhodovulum sp. P5]|uniref:YgaP family membrane protein n=1 Tax=Rhodovulum sp. P5 TaxID=1564506 RepID=UPI0009C2BA94|nr:DUF2892 domain-containing protein [Rhodovulum sp. P5]ARE42045.1 hypothetical protein RGUI_3904 [Rhodovulum sp. P5]
MLKKNVGGIDRIARIVVGALLLAFGLLGGGHWIFVILGLVALGTGIMQTCMLYNFIGVNTCTTKD